MGRIGGLRWSSSRRGWDLVLHFAGADVVACYAFRVECAAGNGLQVVPAAGPLFFMERCRPWKTPTTTCFHLIRSIHTITG